MRLPGAGLARVVALAALLLSPCFAKVEDTPAMPDAQLSAVYDRIDAIMTARNAREIQFRTSYHAGEVEDGRDIEPLEAFLARYADRSRWGEPQPEDVIAGAQRLSPLPFPDDLLAFYRARGALEGSSLLCDLTLLSPAKMLERHGSKERYRQIETLGLPDMIRHTWGNDRPEVALGSDYYSDDQIRRLNAEYVVIGHLQHWRDGNESTHYIYFDRKGRFGIFYFHQDEIDLRPLLGESPARQTLAEVLGEALQLASEESSDE
ncbi:hypothetical protein ACLBXM_21990 [Xanthobacteraceae bacterium A53D]